MVVWKNVPGYYIYEVSNTGFIRNKNTGRILKPHYSWDGSALVGLSNNGVQTTYTIHRLVASVFIDKPEGCNFVRHKDGDKTNSAVDNLYWSRTRRLEKNKELVLV